jgi:hypothetical protein
MKSFLPNALNKGNGSFTSGGYAFVGPSPRSIALGDFNGDNAPDAAVAASDAGAVTVLLNKGNGSFLTGVSYPVGTSPYAVVAGDFDGKGFADLVVANHGSNTVSVLFSKPNGTFEPAVSYATGVGPSGLAAGDWNRDRRLDLAVANAGVSPDFAGSVTVLLGRRRGIFKPVVNYTAVGASPVSIVPGDFNGDGYPDLALVNNSAAGMVTVLLNDRTGSPGPTPETRTCSSGRQLRGVALSQTSPPDRDPISEERRGIAYSRCAPTLVHAAKAPKPSRFEVDANFHQRFLLAARLTSVAILETHDDPLADTLALAVADR